MAAVLLLGVSSAGAATLDFSALLTGPSENPPNISIAIGTAVVTWDTTAQTMRVQLTFTTAGAILAETFVALPFFVITVEAALRSMDRRYEDVASHRQQGSRIDRLALRESAYMASEHLHVNQFWNVEPVLVVYTPGRIAHCQHFCASLMQEQRRDRPRVPKALHCNR